jgi:hypothetical protein
MKIYFNVLVRNLKTIVLHLIEKGHPKGAINLSFVFLFVKSSLQYDDFRRKKNIQYLNFVICILIMNIEKKGIIISLYIKVNRTLIKFIFSLLYFSREHFFCYFLAYLVFPPQHITQQI